MRGLILYGPPAAGKDTITEALHTLDSTCVLFPRLKVGGGITTGYRMTDVAAVSTLHADDNVIWANHRYGSLYVIDRPTLTRRLRHHIPVLHLGQPEAIAAVVAATPDTHWLVVSLWCPRHAAERRLRARPTGDTAERLRAWDETPPLHAGVPTLNTTECSPSGAARRIHRLLTAGPATSGD